LEICKTSPVFSVRLAKDVMGEKLYKDIPHYFRGFKVKIVSGKYKITE